MDHADLNPNLLNVLREEAESCLKRGEKEEAQALYKSLIRISFPIVEEEVRQNPQIAIAILAESKQPGPPGEAATVLLNHLRKKGLAPK